MKITIRLALIPQPLLPKWEKGSRMTSKSLSRSGLRCTHKSLVCLFRLNGPLNPPIPGDFAVMSPPELGGGGGQMQDFGLSFEMCVHGSPLWERDLG